ncbi:hypothetical protein D187_005226 [Cystobacter fuscus DSM 2262]|uniref:Uncharacterized protein n=1 Tax=Cystobacter fuscus (strain ATCC 25194 / DSM 2262 / NBRC 100088 / M29) TaxID=1242864 RepID=S9R576_CYSF2|nr:hypothetical protein [Cystobacter fuscus]EPX64093.1 hypothetical protein D187_005226 [Cystobacter fuscus DSM 2262]
MRNPTGWGGWPLIVFFLFFLHAACATGVSRNNAREGSHSPSLESPPEPGEQAALTAEPGSKSATVYELEFMEPRAVPTRPVPISPGEFQQTFRRLARDVRLAHGTPREAAHVLLRPSREPRQDIETVESGGDWEWETYRGQGYTLVPRNQPGPVLLTPVADDALKAWYLKWCEHRGGGDCLGLLDDGPYLRADDRRVLALALALGPVLDETWRTLAHELMDVRAMVSLAVWTVAIYCMMWVVPEPTTKALAATLTVILMSWLGLETMWELMDGYSRMAVAAHEATTFEELRAAGDAFGKVLGKDAARALLLAVASLSGRTMGEVAARVKSLPGFGLAGRQWKAQGGAAVMSRVEAEETALAREGALARAVEAVEMVATSPQSGFAVVMLKRGPGGGAGKAPGGRSWATLMRHRGGNQQVELSDGQHWHLPRGKSVADIPAEDRVGDMIQEVVTQAVKEWGPHRLSANERLAIGEAQKKGKYWLARLLEREARGRYVHAKVEKQFQASLKWNRQGVDMVDLNTGRQYEILSGTESNLARHGRRMATEFFRMITF